MVPLMMYIISENKYVRMDPLLTPQCIYDNIIYILIY